MEILTRESIQERLSVGQAPCLSLYMPTHRSHPHNLHDIRLFEGNRHSLVEIELPAGIPKTIADALGDELTGKHSTVASYGGVSGESSSMHHGYGGRKEEVELAG